MSTHRKSQISKFKSPISNLKSPSPAPQKMDSILPVTSISPKNGEFWETPVLARSFNLTDIQLLAIEHTLRGARDSQTAEMLDINRKTLWNWKTFNEDYRRALAEGRAAIHAAVI